MRTKEGKPGFRDIVRLGGRSVIDHLGRLEDILLFPNPSLAGRASAQRISPGLGNMKCSLHCYISPFWGLSSFIRLSLFFRFASFSMSSSFFR